MKKDRTEKGQGEIIIIILFFVFICILSEFMMEDGGLITYAYELFFESETETTYQPVDPNVNNLPCWMRVSYEVEAINIMDSEDMGGDEPYIFYELFFADGNGILRSYFSGIWSSSEELGSGTALGYMYEGWPHKLSFSDFDVNFKDIDSDIYDVFDGAFGGPPPKIAIDIPYPFSGTVGIYIVLMESDMDRAAEFARATYDMLEKSGIGNILDENLSTKNKAIFLGGYVWAYYLEQLDDDEFLGEAGNLYPTVQLDYLIRMGQTEVTVHNFSGWDKLTPFEYEVKTNLTPEYYDFRCH